MTPRNVDKIVSLSLVFHCQVLYKGVNGAMFRLGEEEKPAFFFSQSAIEDRFENTHDQKDKFFNVMNDFDISEHELIRARRACRLHAERKLLTDQRVPQSP